MFNVLLIIALFLLKTTTSSRILCLFIVPSYSHQQFFIPTCKELSLRGHQVVMATSYPYKDPSLVNLTEIDLSYLNKFYGGSETIVQTKLATTTGQWPHQILLNGLELVAGFAEMIFQDANFKRIYQNSSEHFDLVIVQNVVPTFYSFAARFKAPLIGMSSIDGLYNCHSAIGNAYNPSVYSDFQYDDHSYDTFKTRLYRTWYYVFSQFYYYWRLFPREDERARKFLGDGLPYLGDLEKDVSMQFLNGNPLMTSVRAVGPTTIYLTQMHIKPLKELPKDLKKILDEAKHGVVYFSLGSNVKSSSIHKSLLETIIHDISQLPYTVLWKWEADDFPGKPKNVVTRKWFPQQDLLAHPNVKVFVCQGGSQSLEEAVIRGVPVIGIPFLIDQPVNTDKLVKAGIGLKVDPNGIRKDQLKEAILEVAQNAKYKKKVQKLQKIALDQHMTGLEKAVWWSEYVIRHNGTKHLRNPTADMPLYEYLLVDVILMHFAILVVIQYLARMALKNLRGKRKIKVG